MIKKSYVFDKYFQYITLVVSIMVLTFVITQYTSTKKDIANQEYSYRLSKEYSMILDSINIKQMELKKYYDDLIYKNKIKNDTMNYSQYNNHLKEIDSRMEKISQQILSLRQAINPMKPDEILTIARLKDAIEIIDKRQNNFEKDINANIESFKNSVIRELNSANSSANWLFVVLIPLVLNLFYSIWKDFRESKGKQKEVV